MSSTSESAQGITPAEIEARNMRLCLECERAVDQIKEAMGSLQAEAARRVMQLKKAKDLAKASVFDPTGALLDVAPTVSPELRKLITSPTLGLLPRGF